MILMTAEDAPVVMSPEGYLVMFFEALQTPVMTTSNGNETEDTNFTRPGE